MTSVMAARWAGQNSGPIFAVCGCLVFGRPNFGGHPNFWPNFINVGHHRTCGKVWWRSAKRPRRLGGEKKKEDLNYSGKTEWAAASNYLNLTLREGKPNCNCLALPISWTALSLPLCAWFDGDVWHDINVFWWINEWRAVGCDVHEGGRWQTSIGRSAGEHPSVSRTARRDM